MKDFEVKFRWGTNARVRRWKVKAFNEGHAQRSAERILKIASATAKVVSVREIAK